MPAKSKLGTPVQGAAQAGAPEKVAATISTEELGFVADHRHKRRAADRRRRALSADAMRISILHQVRMQLWMWTQKQSVLM